MNDVRLRWSVWPWTRPDDDERKPGVPGAAISDSRRQVTYRATVDAQGKLDHLEIEMSGHIDDVRLARLRSIPRERIEQAVVAFLRAQKPDEITVFLDGGLLARKGPTPTGAALYAEVAELMATKGWSRQELAAHFLPDEQPAKAVRRVDHWILKARALHPEVAPRSATGRGFRPATADQIERARRVEIVSAPPVPNPTGVVRVTSAPRKAPTTSRAVPADEVRAVIDETDAALLASPWVGDKAKARIRASRATRTTDGK